MWDVTWHPSGKILASCGQDRVVRLWTLASGTWKLSDILKDAHSKTIRRVSFSPDGKKLAAAGFDGIVSIWAFSGNEWSCAANLEGHEHEVKGVCWSPDGRILATCGRDKTVWLWELNPGEEDYGDTDDVDFECLAVLSEHAQDVKCVNFHPIESHTLLSASYDDTVKIWKADMAHDDEWTCRQTLSNHSSTVWSSVFSPCGNYILTVGEDMRILIYKKQGGKFALDCKLDYAHERAILALTVQQPSSSLDQEKDPCPELLLATASSDRSLKFWRYDTQIKKLFCIDKYVDPDRIAFNGMQWNPANQHELAACGDNGKVLILKILDAA